MLMYLALYITLHHCWMAIKECPKWEDLYSSLNKGDINDSTQ
jgi:hypothetical protein